LFSYYDLYGEEFRAKEDCSRPLFLFISPSPNNIDTTIVNLEFGEGVRG